MGDNLLRELDEVIILVIRKHWVALWRPVLEGVLALLLLVPLVVWDLEAATLPFLAAIAVAGHAVFLMMEHQRDRLVLTNLRLMRYSGVIGNKRATVPVQRILDITTDKPWWGQIFGFGHLTFESAAQVQGLRQYTYVTNADAHEYRIQLEVHSKLNRKPIESLDRPPVVTGTLWPPGDGLDPADP